MLTFKGRGWSILAPGTLSRPFRGSISKVTPPPSNLTTPLIWQCPANLHPSSIMIHTALLLMTITIFAFTVTFLYIKVNPSLGNVSAMWEERGARAPETFGGPVEEIKDLLWIVVVGEKEYPIVYHCDSYYL